MLVVRSDKLEVGHNYDFYELDLFEMTSEVLSGRATCAYSGMFSFIFLWGHVMF